MTEPDVFVPGDSDEQNLAAGEPLPDHPDFQPNLPPRRTGLPPAPPAPEEPE